MDRCYSYRQRDQERRCGKQHQGKERDRRLAAVTSVIPDAFNNGSENIEAAAVVNGVAVVDLNTNGFVTGNRVGEAAVDYLVGVGKPVAKATSGEAEVFSEAPGDGAFSGLDGAITTFDFDVCLNGVAEAVHEVHVEVAGEVGLGLHHWCRRLQWCNQH